MQATNVIIRPWEREAFKRCRRRWDLSARDRQNWEPAAPAVTFDAAAALRDAMAVYYFPGMWDWSRTIVAPLATAAFEKSMRRHRQDYEAVRPLTDGQEAEWERHFDAGRELLEAYYRWAPEVDRFSAVQVESLFDVTVPDPQRPPDGLLTPGGQGIDYRVRIELVVVDEHELYWLVDHRVSTGEWPDLDLLLLDEQILSRSWAWELGFLARVSGTIHNQMRLFDRPDPDRPAGDTDLAVFDRGGRLIRQEDQDPFRRTQIPRGRHEIEDLGVRVASELSDMSQPGLPVYPTPADDTCPACPYRSPCLAIQTGADPTPVLEASYRKCTTPDFEHGKLGSVWGFVPHTGDETRVRLNPPARLQQAEPPPPPPPPPDS